MINLEKTKEILRQEDVQGFIRMGAPDDEYDHLAEKIVSRINFEREWAEKHYHPKMLYELDSDLAERALLITYCCMLESFCFGYKMNENEERFACFLDTDFKSVGPMDKYRTIVMEILNP